MTSVEPGPAWAERLNPRNWTLTWKLVVVGLVPALLALALGVLRIADDAGQAAELGRSSRLVEIRDQVAGAANALRQERDESTLFVAGNRAGDRGVLEIGFGQADGEIDEMVNALRGTGELDATTAAALQGVERALTELAALRTGVTDNPAVPSDQVLARYGALIGPLDVLDRALLRQLRTPDTAGLADAMTAVTGAVEQLSVEHTVLGAAIRAGRLLPGDAATLNVAAAQLGADYRDYRSAVSPDRLARFGDFLDDPANARREQLKAALLAAPPGPLPVPANDWDAAYSGSRGAADRTAELIRGDLVAVSSAAEDRASNLAGINSVILMLGLLVGVTIAVLVSRGLVRSLRVLRTSALDVADRRLPQTVDSVRAGDTPDVTVAPVPLTGRDEVTQVARAFDAVHLQAIRLAADQATLQAGISAMFVNLSRRSQALVERQLQLIEQLEANEQDADQLSNLFQLDHLATRMRRNSENLLVLAGTDVAKRNVAAVPMVDVLRAAVSEVEQYQRVVVQAPPDSTILGRAASDIVHLLAELLDNATNFSPPDSQVVMSSTRTAEGAVVVEIADRGVGMTDDELAAANSRVAGPGSVDVSTSRRMGLIVVGRLAARHGIDVRLSSSAAGGSGSGLTAVVTVPTKLVPTGEPRRAGALPGTRLSRQPAAPSAGPAQRPVRNGARPDAPLSALVSGADWPAEPAAEAGRAGGPANGTVNGLPTRQPGQHLRAAAAGFPLAPERPGAADRLGGAAPGQGRPAADWTTPADRATPDRPGDTAPPADRTAAGSRPTAFRPSTDGPAADRPTADDPAEDPAAGRTARDAALADRAGAGTERPAGTGSGTDRPAGDDTAAAASVQDGPAAGRSPARSAGRPVDAPAAAGGADLPTSDTPPAGRSAVEPSAEPAGAGRSAADKTDKTDETVDTAGNRPPATGPANRGSAPVTPIRHPAADPDFVPGAAPAGRAAQDTPSGGIPAAPARPSPRRADAEPRTAPGAGPAEPAGDHAGAPRTDPTPLVELPRTPPPPTPASPQRRPSPVPQRPAAQDRATQQPLPQRRPTQPQRYPLPDRPGRADPGQRSWATPRPAGDLFASPVEPAVEPESASATGLAGLPFDPSETTPIFEEIASAWFRSNRTVPVQYAAPEAEPAAAPGPPREPLPTAAPFGAGRPPVAEPAAAERVTADHGFASLADEGWRAARGASASRGDELTPAGLPKRRPRARLVPGSAGSAVLAAPAAPARSAESIRGRLSSYQQGVRMGRESRLRGEADADPTRAGGKEQANAQGNHDEESS